jgi:hypothetical protein
MEQDALCSQYQHNVIRIWSLIGPRATAAEEVICSVYALKTVLQKHAAT